MSKTPRIHIDYERLETFVNGKEVALCPAERKILHALMTTKKALTREQLGREIGHTDEQIELGGRTVDQHIARLRRKLNGHRDAIQTVSGHGYRIAAQYAA